MAPRQYLAWALDRSRRRSVWIGAMIGLGIAALLTVLVGGALLARPKAEPWVAVLVMVLLGPGLGLAIALGSWLRLRGPIDPQRTSGQMLISGLGAWVKPGRIERFDEATWARIRAFGRTLSEVVKSPPKVDREAEAMARRLKPYERWSFRVALLVGLGSCFAGDQDLIILGWGLAMVIGAGSMALNGVREIVTGRGVSAGSLEPVSGQSARLEGLMSVVVAGGIALMGLGFAAASAFHAIRAR